MDPEAPTGHHDEAHDGHHEPLSFWRKYVFSTDHKVIGIQYGVTALLFLLFGFTLMMVMRLQLAYPGEAFPIIGGSLFGRGALPGGIMLPEFYNLFGAMHGTIMVFLGVVPLAVGGLRQLRRCRCRSAPRTWPSRSSTWPATGCYFIGRRDHAAPASSCPAAPPSRAGPPTRRSRP